MPPSSLTGAPFSVDVVVVGGGIQGLWLLADLDEAGYKAILLERMHAGFGQTGHSHVFLHEGHMFASMLKEPQEQIISRIEDVQAANRRWKAELQQGRLKGLEVLQSRLYVGWNKEDSAINFEAVCQLAGLTCTPVNTSQDLPDVQGILRFYASESTCLESKALLDHFLTYRDLRQNIGYFNEINVTGYGSEGFGLVVKRNSKGPLEISGLAESVRIGARALVLTAGAGNERLIDGVRSASITTDPIMMRQQTVKTFMLVLRQIDGSLPYLSAMFPDFGGLFIASRQDSQKRNVWLIGNGQRVLVPCPGEMTALTAGGWFQGLKTKLDHLFPGITANRDNYQWGVYEATKAEAWTANKLGVGGKFPTSYHVKKHDTIPLWVTWPTLLTFAPAVASQIVTALQTDLGGPASLSIDRTMWNNFCSNSLASECRWKTTPMLSWKDFTRCFI